MSISKRIKQVVDKSGLSVEKFSEQIKEKSFRVRDVINEKQRPPAEMIASIVEIFLIDANWLLTGAESLAQKAAVLHEDQQAEFRTRLKQETERLSKGMAGAVAQIDAASKNLQPEIAETPNFLLNNDTENEYVQVSAYDVFASAGHGADVFDQPSRRKLAFRQRWLNFKGLNIKDLVAIWAKGDSMEPLISEMTTLLINRAQTFPIDGKIYVLRSENNLFVKRLQVQPNGGLLLLSDNKEAYPPILLSKKEMETVEIIGQVVHISRDV